MAAESPKTEKELLEEGVKLSVLTQRLKELHEYIDRLMERMDVEMKRDRVGSMVYLGSWLFWVVMDVVFPWGKGIWTLPFVMGLIYSHYTTTKLLRTFSELDGVFNTLRILGMMSDVPDRPTKNKRWVIDEFVEKVRSWVEKIKAEKATGLSPA